MDSYYTRGKILTTDTTNAPWGDGSTVLTSLHTDGNLNEAHIVLTTSHVSKVTRPLGELDFLLSTANVDGGLSTGETIVKQTSSDPVLRLSNVDDNPSSMAGKYLLTNESDLVANYNTQNPGNKILTQENCQGNTLATGDSLLKMSNVNGNSLGTSSLARVSDIPSTSAFLAKTDCFNNTLASGKKVLTTNEVVGNTLASGKQLLSTNDIFNSTLVSGKKVLTTNEVYNATLSTSDKLLKTSNVPSWSTSTRLVTFADLPGGKDSYKCCKVENVNGTQYFKNSYGIYFEFYGTDIAACVISLSQPTTSEIIIPKYIYTDELVRYRISQIEKDASSSIDFTSNNLKDVKKVSAPWFEGKVYGGIIFNEGLNIDFGMLTETDRSAPIVQKIGASLTVSTSWKPISADFEPGNYDSGFELNIRRYENTEANKTIKFSGGSWSAISDNVPHGARYNIDVDLFDATARASFMDAWGYTSQNPKNFELSIIP